jgi:uncharacterized membrane protein
MMRQHATTTVAASLADVQTRLADVTSWPAFLYGLESVEPAGHERYRFTLDTGGRRSRTVLVCVQQHPAEHRVSWRQLEGPRYFGELRLREAGASHTTVELTMVADPVTMAEGFRELLGERHPAAELDLQRLDHLVTEGDPRGTHTP